MKLVRAIPVLVELSDVGIGVGRAGWCGRRVVVLAGWDVLVSRPVVGVGVTW